ncbi:hypothetical protein AB0B89_31155 [Sphaerisporangium sp. NPDC049002]|uniref:hypothetical protein n=1 Tax=Sphaerisporangium sp. NPDC049002 TaxID=3155392 RepID=UPI0033D16839
MEFDSDAVDQNAEGVADQGSGKREFLDTQIISYALKGKIDVPAVEGRLIASATAHELLRTWDKEEGDVAYYIPVPSIGIRELASSRPKHHPPRKQSTDLLPLYLGENELSVVEYGHLAISLLINSQEVDLLLYCTRHLDKHRRDVALRYFEFLTQHSIRCIAATSKVVPDVVELFRKFRARFSPKGDFRNTLNDILVLATALNVGAPLLTRDGVLNRFASEYYGTPLIAMADYVKIDFGHTSARRRISRDSKGYINRPWRSKLIE